MYKSFNSSIRCFYEAGWSARLMRNCLPWPILSSRPPCRREPSVPDDRLAVQLLFRWTSSICIQGGQSRWDHAQIYWHLIPTGLPFPAFSLEHNIYVVTTFQDRRHDYYPTRSGGFLRNFIHERKGRFSHRISHSPSLWHLIG